MDHVSQNQISTGLNGVIDFQNSNATFSNNTGLQGGAIALIGSSVMIVGPNTYKFKNNCAVHLGEAIYVLVIDEINFTTSRCFIQYRDNENKTLLRNWDSIIFKGNEAKGEGKGHSIHTESLIIIMETEP